MTAYDCPVCKGKCCRDNDFGYRVVHMGSESYEHWCEHCYDGGIPPPNPRDTLIAKLREAIAAWPAVPHWYDCGMFEKRGGFYLETECTCGVGAANAARAEARKLAGLE